MSRLKETYKNEIVDAMIKKFGYKNIMEVPKLDKIASAEVEGTRCDKTMARKAIADATGKALPKGVEIEIVAKTVTTYGMDLDKFLSQAQVVSVKDAHEAEADELVG